MAIQYSDGSFSDIEGVDEILKKFQDMTSVNIFPKAVFFGTESEVKEAIEVINVKEEIKTLKERVEFLEPNKSGLHTPTPEDIKKYCKGNKPND